MYGLIEVELTRVRRMADEFGDGFLAYLIDLAIIEANTKARGLSNTVDTTATSETFKGAKFKPRIVA